MKRVVVFLLIFLNARIEFGANGQSQIIPPYTCTTTVCQPGQAHVDTNGERLISQGSPGKRGPIGPKGQKGDPCQCNVADEEAMNALVLEWNSMKKNLMSIKRRLENIEGFHNFLPDNCTARNSALTSEETPYDVVSIYPLKFIGDLTPVMTNCTKILAEGKDGWIVIQRRVDGGTDFYRNWESYVKGFGDRNGEFWIGLQNLHVMTSERVCKLRIDFKDWDKSTRFAEYSTFRVSDENSDFALTVSGYSGDIQDSMAHHNNRRFSTYDRDNDDHSLHCAKRYTGAWWHGECHDSNLNGKYFKTPTADNTGIWWDGFSKSLPLVEMKLLCV